MEQQLTPTRADTVHRRRLALALTFLGGLGIGLVFFLGVVYVVTVIGGISLVVHDGNLLTEAWIWTVDNLGLAAIAFLIVFAWYGRLLYLLRRELDGDAPTEQRVVALDHRLDLIAGVCFGIGVIFTAIGLRGALIYALGDLDEGEAGALGAFEILGRLVDGGILLALSTTIVGGVAGYLMRIIKSFWIGGRIMAFVLAKQDDAQHQVLKRLDAIERAVADNTDQGEAMDVGEALIEDVLAGDAPTRDA